MKPRILLVNPPIYDFSAYDFWLKPYGMLTAAGFLRNRADFVMFDYLDRMHPFARQQEQKKSGGYGKGRFYEQKTTLPRCLSEIPRYFRRFGLPRRLFTETLRKNPHFDYAFIQTSMTYWYQGVSEVITDLRKFCPETKIILGGNYATLCPEHAKTLEPDLIVQGDKLDVLYDFIGISPDYTQPGLWEVYPELETGVLKLTDGCPFNCSYCSVPKVYGGFKPRSLQRYKNEFDLLAAAGVKNIAFYDDALLYKPEAVFLPLLKHIRESNTGINLHSPNALNARLLTDKTAEEMVSAGFRTFYIGFESSSRQWQKQTGSKVFSSELVNAVNNLKEQGIPGNHITAYQILGHPDGELQRLEESMHFVNSLGIRGMLADFSPIPGTPDGNKAGKIVDMSEPLNHNKTAFPIRILGFDETNRLKDLQRKLNRQI